MDFRAGLITVCALWLLGALTTTFFTLAFTRATDKRKGISGKNPFITAAVAIVLNLFLWPFLGRTLWAWYGQRLAVMLRFRPAWTITSGKERESHSWLLKDGTGLQADAICYSSGDPAHIKVLCEHDLVDYRLRMIAPSQTAPTDWFSMERPSKEEWTKETREYRERGEYYDETPAFGASRQLKPGKYQVDFRVRLPSGEIEELSALTLVVT